MDDYWAGPTRAASDGPRLEYPYSGGRTAKEDEVAALTVALVGMVLAWLVTGWELFTAGSCNGDTSGWVLDDIARARHTLTGLVVAGLLVAGCGAWRYPRRGVAFLAVGALMAFVPFLALITHSGTADWTSGFCVG